jgi:S1-C subfamily serine protease
MMGSAPGETIMTTLTLLLLAVQAVPSADAPKKAFIGVQMAVTGKPDEVIIQIVFKDSPAMKAGLKGGDILLSVDGVKFEGIKAAVDIIRSLKPGKKAKFRVRRGEKEHDITVVPGEM